jgi:predicted metal-binding membrane protein
MPMRGEWTNSMMWMPMPGQTCIAAAASFLGMWILMMVPMMLPTVAPVLWRHREAVKLSGARRPVALTAIAGVGYFFVWAVVGLAGFPVGTWLMGIVSDHVALARAVPIAVGLTVTIAGAVQLTSWKARQLAGCRWACLRHASRPFDVVGAWRYGVRLGSRCVACCANLMMIPLIVGVMDVRAMAAVGAAIAVERLAPRGERMARVTGVVLVAAGGLLMARVVGP